jgi:hypothetical protein
MLGGQGASIPNNNDLLAAKLITRLQATIVSDTTWGGSYGGLLNNAGAPTYNGERAHYWSSTSFSASVAYYLVYNAGYVLPQANSNKLYGFRLRCVRE